VARELGRGRGPADPLGGLAAGLNTGARCITPGTAPSTPGGIAKFVLAEPGLTDTTVTPERPGVD
jgi:hypothetical protein